MRNIALRNWLLMITVSVSVCAAYLGGRCLAARTAADPLQQSIAAKVLRFHVRANSDSDLDQSRKLKVRDAVGRLLHTRIGEAEDMETVRRIIRASMDEIVAEAEEALWEDGCGDRVTARLTRTDFPQKTYGAYTFPAGEYEALELEIGKGQGHNWWCVLYPNMCFRGSVYEVVSEEAGEALREVLSPEEYTDVLESGNYEVRLKFLDWFR